MAAAAGPPPVGVCSEAANAIIAFRPARQVGWTTRAVCDGAVGSRRRRPGAGQGMPCAGRAATRTTRSETARGRRSMVGTMSESAVCGRRLARPGADCVGSGRQMGPSGTGVGTETRAGGGNEGWAGAWWEQEPEPAPVRVRVRVRVGAPRWAWQRGQRGTGRRWRLGKQGAWRRCRHRGRSRGGCPGRCRGW